MGFENLDQWRQASAWLDDVLDRDAGQRAACLAALGARDPALARHLGRILDLAGQPGPDRFLAHAVDHGADAPEALAGSVIGRHVVEAFVARGASASVWRARRLDVAGAPVVLKVLHGSLVGRPQSRRFEAEAAWLQRVAGRGIPRWHESGIALQGRPYLVLDHVSGTRIASYCDERRLAVAQRVALVAEVAAIMARVHALHVLHCDIKPDNVLVTDGGRPVLVDFGIAVDARASPRGSAAPVCTPAYAAPEQLAGRAPSRSTDIYSLGALLRQLLVGCLPLPERARARLESLVSRTVHEDPAQRPASMGELRRDLARLARDAVGAP
jgi:serine/threonine-protein kinase